MSGAEAGWPAFLAGYHARDPAVTEDLLLPMRGPGGQQPYAWLVEGLPGQGAVWDVCCGSAPVADVVGRGRYHGVDTSQEEVAEARRRRPGVHVVVADALDAVPPVPPAAVTVAMALMLLPLEAFLARAAGLLPPGGALHAIVPTREHAAADPGTGYATLLRLLGQTGRGYRQPLAPDVLAAAAAAAGFEVRDDETAVLQRPVPAGDVDLVVRSFYVRDPDAPGPAAARGWLGAAAEDPAFRLSYPLRRVRLVRT